MRVITNDREHSFVLHSLFGSGGYFDRASQCSFGSFDFRTRLI
jgi:hypothetical protein